MLLVLTRDTLPLLASSSPPATFPPLHVRRGDRFWLLEAKYEQVWCDRM